MKNIVLIGPPGSGKDTQVQELKNRFDFVSISGGDVSRALGEKDPKLKAIVDLGELIDDNLILRELDWELNEIAPEVGIIFNGIPRTMYQAEQINQILVRHNRTLDGVVYINVSEEEVVKRLSSRKVCSVCGHVITPIEEVCDFCGGTAKKRDDDEPAAIINRMQSFLENTLPLITYFNGKGILTEIDGEKSPEKVTEEIIERLELCQNKTN